MQLPREPRAGDPLDGAWGAQVVRYLRSITLVNGPGVRVRHWAGGTTLEAAKAKAASAATHPFQVVDASTAAPAAKVRVVFGQVNSITPTIDATYLDYDPTLTVVSGVVYLKVNLDGDGLVASAEIGNAAALPADTATEGHLTLANVNVAADAVIAISQSVTHSLGHQKCGEDIHNFWGL